MCGEGKASGLCSSAGEAAPFWMGLILETTTRACGRETSAIDRHVALTGRWTCEEDREPIATNKWHGLVGGSLMRHNPSKIEFLGGGVMIFPT